MPNVSAKVRVLVVDDEPFNLEIIREYLDAPGFELTMAHDGVEAWALLEDAEREFDLLVLDRMMPRLDGMEVLRRVQRTPRLRGMPVIMQTAAATPDQVREGLEAGARYYLTKPYEPDALLAIVKSALDEVRRTREILLQVEDIRRAMCMLTHAEFEFATLKQATELSTLASLAAPQPENIVMGLSELLINAVEHGNLGITYAEKSRLRLEDRWQEEVERRLQMPQNAGKRARLTVERSAAEVRFTVSDQGRGFDYTRYLDFDPERAFDPNGRGIAMARQLSFKRLEYIGSGNVVSAAVDVQ
ncbi:response regulator [Methyloversatilis sp. RAC08]|uniref:response regulator n=1 Tax=Methyloversatilis sp. RAC08 TaxID=1842540 RepID=UPI00083D8437|nr:response regulator [Methyloversatilis sp. RAC08]AOF81524.1 response regulator [Methyloversatilis sp. RAC08]